jgi:damage-control phosphatase, subfamily I
MKTYLECIPCFLNQALRAMDQSSLQETKKAEVLKSILNELADYELNKTPPEFALFIYDLLEKITGIKDPYRKIKKRDNDHALKLYPEINELVKRSEDSLLIAVKAAIAGNMMDFASGTDYDITGSIKEIIKKEFTINNYKEFAHEIKDAKSISYIADNSGEIVFDKLLLEQIRKFNDAKIDFYVRKRPIVDDATIEDAEYIKISDIKNLEIKTFDSNFPKGKIDSDIIISKGQANYECLSNSKENIFFMLMTKCVILARDLKTEKHKLILKKNIGQ